MSTSKSRFTDIETANRLANVVLGQSMDELVKPSRTLLSKIYEMVKEQAEQNNAPIDEIFFTRRMIREYTGWSDWQVRAHIKQLEEMEYIRCPHQLQRQGVQLYPHLSGPGGGASRKVLPQPDQR
ncbi:MAG: hypothetical protein JKP90_06755 [Desulfofustis sp. PB-SRB1]|nr:hypothetical protein [Desulfofustis sp. PB-SRB1]